MREQRDDSPTLADATLAAEHANAVLDNLRRLQRSPENPNG